MPVTVKLSRKFYDRFGDDIANELVEWFNQVDLAYRQEIRDLMETHFSRFEARLEQRLGEVSSGLRTELAGMRADLIKWMFLFWATTALGVIGLLKF